MSKKLRALEVLETALATLIVAIVMALVGISWLPAQWVAMVRP